MAGTVQIGELTVGEGQPLTLIAGPCVLESEDLAHRTAAALRAICATVGVPLIFKSSFDKANRTSGTSFRGLGMDEGLRILEGVRQRFGVPVTTDVHLPGQVPAVAQAVDLLQVPAFLCRQTDLLLACGASGRPVNVKKGQFLAPEDMRYVVDKVHRGGTTSVIVTERGTCFGYHDLVVDMRSIPRMADLGVPVCFDVTHSVQQPTAHGGHSGGQREYASTLAFAAVAAGCHLVFAEVHPDPDAALSDAATQLPLDRVEGLLERLKRIAAAR